MTPVSIEWSIREEGNKRDVEFLFTSPNERDAFVGVMWPERRAAPDHEEWFVLPSTRGDVRALHVCSHVPAATLMTVHVSKED